VHRLDALADLEVEQSPSKGLVLNHFQVEPMNLFHFTPGRWLKTSAAAGLLIGGLAIYAMPAEAQRCFNQNGQTICCDNSGNCYSR